MPRIILVFGHLPKYVGGKQSSGLSNVMWNLAYHMNLNGGTNFKISFVSTDINFSYTNIKGVDVYGWNFSLLFFFIIRRLDLVLYYLFKSFKVYFRYRLNFFNSFFKFIFFHHSLEKIKPDFIHLHGPISVLNFELMNFDKYKTFLTIHGLSGLDNKIRNHYFNKKLELDLNKKKKLFTSFISKGIISQWIEAYDIPNCEYFSILNSFDSSVFYFNEFEFKLYSNKVKNHIILASIGSLSDLKGQLRVIEALKSFDKKEFKYICYGEGDNKYLNILKNSAKNDIDFEYKGYFKPDDLRKELYNVDFMILPSSSEGFGLVFLESIACGVPVILPKNLPITLENDLLTNENSILLNDDSVESIILCLSKILDLKFNKYRVSNSLSKFSWNDVSIKYLSVLSNY